jgi:hypothetical protein
MGPSAQLIRFVISLREGSWSQLVCPISNRCGRALFGEPIATSVGPQAERSGEVFLLKSQFPFYSNVASKSSALSREYSDAACGVE